MAQTWNEVLARLDVAVKRIRQFTSDASHELRTPLALIRATAELALRRERDPEGYRTAPRQIEQEAENMTGLTESLLTLARADADGLGMTMKSTDLNQLVHSVVQQSVALASEKGVTLSAVTTEQPAHAAAAYFGIDWDVVWRAAWNRCPVLRQQVAGILSAQSGAPEGDGR